MSSETSNKFNILRNYKKYDELINSGAVFCAFDTETTGLNSEIGRIIEIGAVKFNKDGIIDTFGTLIDPKIPIPPEASAVNHITDSMVQGLPDETVIIPKFNEFAKDTVLVAHNAQFDLRFVNASLKRIGLPFLQNKAIDTLIFTRAVFPDIGHWTLQSLAELFSIDSGSAHRAEDDARVCMEIFLKAVEKTKISKISKKTV